MNFKYYSLLAVAFIAASEASTVTLTTSDTAGSSSFNTANKWSDSAAPSAANDYVVSVQWLRTPANGGSYTFGGNSLTLNSGGGLLYKGTGTSSVLTINNLILNGGLIRSGSSNADRLTLAGTINIIGTGSEIRADQSPFTINSALTGTGDLISSGTNFGVTYTASNSYTGNLTVSSTSSTYTTTFSSTSGWSFTVGANGVNNEILGSGYLTLSGAFNINLLSANATYGNSWALVAASTLNENYTSSFSVTGFTPDAGAVGSRLWTKSQGDSLYTYSESTGVLSIVPEPSSAIMATGALALFGIRRRRD